MIYLADRNGYVEPERFAIYFCKGCDLQSVKIQNYDFQKLYNEIYKNRNIVGYSRYWYYADIVKSVANPLEYLAYKESMYYAVFETLRRYRCKKLLEVGSGLGYLTYALTQAGYDCLGVDVSKPAVEFSKQRFGNNYLNEDIFNFLDSTTDIYDLIIVNEVIEHVEDPRMFISNLVKRLNKNGYLLFTTPNKSIFKHETIWATDSPPVHLHWFSENTFEVLSKEICFRFDLIDFSDFHKKNKFCLDLNKAMLRNERKHVFDSQFNLINPTHESGLLRKPLSKFKNIIKYYYSLLLKKFGNPIFIGNKQGKTLAVLIYRP